MKKIKVIIIITLLILILGCIRKPNLFRDHTPSIDCMENYRACAERCDKYCQGVRNECDIECYMCQEECGDDCESDYHYCDWRRDKEVEESYYH